MALECQFKGLSDQAVPKQLREYLKSLGFGRAQVQGDPEGALNHVLDRATHGLSGVDSATVTSQGQTSGTGVWSASMLLSRD